MAKGPRRTCWLVRSGSPARSANSTTRTRERCPDHGHAPCAGVHRRALKIVERAPASPLGRRRVAGFRAKNCDLHEVQIRRDSIPSIALIANQLEHLDLHAPERMAINAKDSGECRSSRWDPSLTQSSTERSHERGSEPRNISRVGQERGRDHAGTRSGACFVFTPRGTLSAFDSEAIRQCQMPPSADRPDGSEPCHRFPGQTLPRQY